MAKMNIKEIPEYVEGYLIGRDVVGERRPTHYFILADAKTNLEQKFHLPKFLQPIIDDVMGEFVGISKKNKKVTLTPGGLME